MSFAYPPHRPPPLLRSRPETRPARALGLATVLAASACAGAPPAARAPDPALTDGDKYHVLLENERVRVLRYHDEAGARTHVHGHPDSIVYALAPFQRRLHLSDGRTNDREFAAGDVVFVPAQTHVGENTGSTPTDVLIVELREPLSSRSCRARPEPARSLPAASR